MESSGDKTLSEECAKALAVDDLRMVLAIDGSGNITEFFPPGVEARRPVYPIGINQGRILAQAALSVVAYEGSPQRVICCGVLGGRWQCWSG